MDRTDRRRFLHMLVASCGAGLLAACKAERPSLSTAPSADVASIERGNFAAVFGDAAARERFRSFLTNVFHLYPEAELQTLISEAASDSRDDREIYQRIAARLPEIAPTLGAFRYALPALRKQQQVMAEQTLQLLDDARRFEGY